MPCVSCGSVCDTQTSDEQSVSGQGLPSAHTAESAGCSVRKEREGRLVRAVYLATCAAVGSHDYTQYDA